MEEEVEIFAECSVLPFRSESLKNVG